jgi:hypothetical protein
VNGGGNQREIWVVVRFEIHRATFSVVQSNTASGYRKTWRNHSKSQRNETKKKLSAKKRAPREDVSQAARIAKEVTKD